MCFFVNVENYIYIIFVGLKVRELLKLKLDREIVLLEKYIGLSDFVQARKIIELNLEKFKQQNVKNKLGLEALSLVNSVIAINTDENKIVYSRETQLIINYLNTLARDSNITTLKRFSKLHEPLLANPKVYDLLSRDAKILIPRPKSDKEEKISQ